MRQARLPRTLLRTLLPTLLRTLLPTLLRTLLPTLLRTLLPTLLRTLLPTLLPTLLRTLLRTLLPTLATQQACILHSLLASLVQKPSTKAQMLTSDTAGAPAGTVLGLVKSEADAQVCQANACVFFFLSVSL
jgi:hypothetical protein